MSYVTNGEKYGIMVVTFLLLEVAMPTNIARFMQKTKCAPNGCIEWTASKDRQGYGFFYLGKQMHAHRASYILFKGPIPEGKIVMHSCDNPSCVNPDHLNLGSHAQNQAQKVANGNSLKGERHHSAKLTSGQVRAIYADDRPQAVIAVEYGVSQPQIARIKQGLTWGHLTGAKPRKPGHFNGVRSYQAKLSAKQVRAIRRSKESTRELCVQYGMSRASINKVRNYITYREVI